MDLAQPRKLGFEVRQGGFKHLAVARVLCGFELLHHSGS